MKTKHTPGPWKIDEDAPPVPRRFVTLNCSVISNGEEAVAVIGANGDRAEANARLIASAPDLLAALEAATERMEALSEGIPVEKRAEGVSQASHVRHMAGHLAQHAKIARAVIKKATAP